MKHDCDNATLAENIKLRADNAKLHAEANINMKEICRLRGQVAKLRSVIVKGNRGK